MDRRIISLPSCFLSRAMPVGVDRRMFLAAAAAAATSVRIGASAEMVLRPEEFGARGDGVTNDSDAFTALSRVIEREGGGTIALRPRRTYIVGRQHPGERLAFAPQPLLAFSGLTGRLTILGNGARLRAAPGLRFGSFDRHSGRPVSRPLPNLDDSLLAAPYRGMIFVHGSHAPVEIRDVELDGNSVGLKLGGQYGDTGWQVPGSGLYLVDNLAEELVENVFSHGHPLDGATISGDPRRLVRSRLARLVCRSNGRQGLSLVGGRGYDFEECDFSSTGRGAIASAPGAGVDIEAEDKTVRDISFTNCKFIDNSGAGMIADSGDTADVRFSRCLFVGTTSWSAWPNKPGFRFERCTFAGSVVHPYPSRDPGKAATFLDCRFSDDPSLSPTGELYFGSHSGGAVVNADPSDNVRFVRCRFELRRGGVLPWSWRATYEDCVMKQASRVPAMTKGKYLGSNLIDGAVDLYGSMIIGSVTLNGKSVSKGPVGSDFRRW